MTKRDDPQDKSCGLCLWHTATWRGSTCKDAGVETTDKGCAKFESTPDFSDYRSLPSMQKVRKALQHGKSHNVPQSVRAELTQFLKSSKATYIPRTTDNITLAMKLASLMATLQANRDRTVELLDIISSALMRVKHLRDSTRVDLTFLNDVAKLGTVKARDQYVDEIMRPILKRYDYLSTLKETATSVLFNIKSGLDTAAQISQLHQLHMRLK